MNRLELAKNIEQFILIPESTSVVEALHILQDAKSRFALVGSIEFPQTMIQKENIIHLPDMSQSLSEILSDLPPLIVIDGIDQTLNGQDLNWLVDKLRASKAPGLLVCENNKVVGIISGEAIADALNPLTAIGEERGLYGYPEIPARTFICRKCPPPYPMRTPRQGFDIPLCPKYKSHGQMTREKV
jgi:CBS domain-containing protein